MKRNTSWNKSAKWYNQIVGDKGHYYHEHLIIPNILKILNLKDTDRLLDLGCGQGILAKNINPKAKYLGVDLAKNLINIANNSDKNKNHSYLLADATKPLPIKDKFNYATAILSLQNMENLEGVIKNANNHLEKDGKFIIVLNHPAFRIPRQSGWGISENKIQYRYINSYMSSQKIPINMHPGDKNSELTWSFHNPISTYSKVLKNNGFVISEIQEWTSDKKTEEGKVSKMENNARAEIPLFMCIVAIKIN